MLVHKYGGTSVGTVERIRAAAKRVCHSINNGEQVIMVVSAMAGDTDRLAGLCSHFPEAAMREHDRVLSCGEEVTIGLAAMALQEQGVAARSFTGAQAGIITDGTHGKARIVDIDTAPLRAALQRGETPVVAGFQGRTAAGDRTTLGRGGSDTTAVALAAAMTADECQIYTDVLGIYTTDPNVCASARLLPSITFEEILEMSSLGSKVLQSRAVEFAGKYRVPLRVLSATDWENNGTLIHYKETNMEKPVVTGVAFNKDEAKITLTDVPDRPGAAAEILVAISEVHVNVDMIVQNIGTDGCTDFSFTVHRSEYDNAMRAIAVVSKTLRAGSVIGDCGIGKVSVVGIGMKSHAGVAATMFKTLAQAGINIQMISTSEIKISVVIEEKYLEQAVQSLHDVFNLDKHPQSE